MDGIDTHNRRWFVDPPRGSGFEARQFDIEEQATEYANRCPAHTRIVDRAPPIDGISAILVERKKTHGEYRDDARAAMRLKDNLADEINRRVVRGQPLLIDTQRHALDMILHKIARIVTGDAFFKDHWDDIAGYAKLVADRTEALDNEVLETTFGPKENYTARDGRPGRRTDDCQDEKPVNGADVLGLNKTPCLCKAHRCLAEDGCPPKYTYCRRAEDADKVAEPYSKPWTPWSPGH